MVYALNTTISSKGWEERMLTSLSTITDLLIFYLFAVK
jgi:hypothetical protein